MAVKGMAVFTHQGEDYTINDPNNAPEFDSTLANVKGEYVYYQGDLYRFNSAHTANTSWSNRSKTKVKLCDELLSVNEKLGDPIIVKDVVWRNGTAYNTGNTNFICPTYVIPVLGADKIAIYADIPLDDGESVYFELNTVTVDSGRTDEVTSANRIRTAYHQKTEKNTANFALIDGEKGFSVQIAKINSSGTIIPVRINQINQNKLHINRYYDQNIGDPVFVRPNWRNGSAFNTGNTDFITQKNILPTFGASQVAVYANIPLEQGEQIKYFLATFNKDNGITDESSAYAIRREAGITVVDDKFIVYDLTKSEKGFVICVCKYANGSNVPLRIENIDASKIQINRFYSVSQSTESTKTEVKNARHIRNGAANPLTILHFSDIHADTAALSRIVDKSSESESMIDEMICTGDIVGNDGGAIASWWKPNILTCIGNHDSAVYTPGSGYDWTGVSMAQRDAWYIAPFESGWGITHTSGTSYYYKDYATQKVRMIVMDCMLYNDNGDEATAQTAWLENLLADAITNDLHVVIAIHAPHGGATKEQCSFSSYGEGTMPTLADCNTPQTIIDAVASKIENGLKFVGYIVGHTHQDNVWDAENDGKQMMYCITCANVAQTAQWTGSDQYRDSTLDAFNLITIDTANTLVKIIRGGGADIDMRMRTRKAICFNYSTGEITGEIL